MSCEVLRGPLSLHSKDGTREGFFILFRDHLEYFSDESAADTDRGLQGRVLLHDVSRFDVAEATLVVHIRAGDHFSIYPPAGSLREWCSIFQGLIEATKVQSTGMDSANRGGNCEAEESLAASSVLCEGLLEMQRKGEFVERYFVLLRDSLKYYQDCFDWENGNSPRGVCAISDIVRWERKGCSFTLEILHHKPLELSAHAERDAEMWLSQISALLAARGGNEQGPPVDPPIIEPPPAPFVAEKQQQQQRSCESEEPEVSVPPSQKPVHEGELLHLKPKKAELRYFVLLCDRLNYFSTSEDFTSGCEPRSQISFGDVLGVRVSDASITLQLAERSFELQAQVADAREVIRAWGHSWEVALEEHAREVGKEAVKVQWETPEDTRIEDTRIERGSKRISSASRCNTSRCSASRCSDPVCGIARRAPSLGATPCAATPRASTPRAAAPRTPALNGSLCGALGANTSRFAPTPRGSRGNDPVDGAVEAIQSLLRRKSMRASNLFHDSRYKRGSTEVASLDEHCIQEICGQAGLDLSVEESLRVMQALDAGGKGSVDLGDLESALRRHHRSNVKGGRESRRRSTRPRGSSLEKLQQALTFDVAERAKARLRSTAYACGGVSWSKVFGHHARRHWGRQNGGIDWHGFLSMLRRDVKIAYRELPDAQLEEVFATVNTDGTGSISYPEFVAWLGVEEEAERELREERAAIRIQALQRGRRARRRVQALKARGPHTLRRGAFTVELRDGTREPWTVTAYEDRLECFSADRVHRIMRCDIKDLEVHDRALVIDVRGGVKLKLHAPAETCVEEWVDAFCRLRGAEHRSLGIRPQEDFEDDVPWSSDDGEPSVSIPSMVSTAASAASFRTSDTGPGTGIGAMSSCSGSSQKPQAGPKRISKSELAALIHGNAGMARFPGVPQLPPHILEDIFGQVGAGRQDISLEELKAFLGTSASSSSRPPAATPGRKVEYSWTVSPELLVEHSQAQLDEWLSSLRDTPIHCGLLSFREAGRQATRCGLLFKDRLECWDSSTDALAGRLPRRCVELRSVHGIEMVRGGFVVNCQGRRVAMHLARGSDARLWSIALHSLLPAPLPLEGRARSVSLRPRASAPVVRRTSVQPTPRRSGMLSARDARRSV